MGPAPRLAAEIGPGPWAERAAGLVGGQGGVALGGTGWHWVALGGTGWHWVALSGIEWH